MVIMENRLKEIMSGVFNLNTQDINEEASMETIPAWDSKKHMELITAIEENFDIPMLSMEEIVAMVRFDKIKEILKSKGL